MKIDVLTCPLCVKEFTLVEWDDINCEDEVSPRCESCDKFFCSEQCAQIEATEDTFPGSCPGVYWCGICKENYLRESQGHRFSIAQHEAHPDLKAYLDLDPDDWSFIEKCLVCGMWCYEYRSHTDVLSKYENQACGVKIR